jgi:hypothetical protein
MDNRCAFNLRVGTEDGGGDRKRSSGGGFLAGVDLLITTSFITFDSSLWYRRHNCDHLVYFTICICWVFSAATTFALDEYVHDTFIVQ